MKKIAIFGLALLMFFTTNAFSRTHYDFFGKNAEKKLAFSNQVIAEILTEEQMEGKARTKELIQGCGDYVHIVDLISGTKKAFEEELAYLLDEQFHEIKHEEMVKGSSEHTKRAMEKEFRDRGIKPGDFKHKIISENPQDIIHVGEMTSSDESSDFGLVYITREVQIKTWECDVRIKAVMSRMNSEKKAEWIEKLKSNSMLNNWISRNR